MYNAALALVHPSSYEGFGLTLLEAMACGTPVIASHAASIPEVAGDAGCLVTPGLDHDLASALIRMEEDNTWRGEWRRKGFENVKRFNWQNTAAQTVEIYRKVLAAK